MGKSPPDENDDMDEKKPESRTIAGEAIGSGGGDAVPDAAKESAKKAPEKAEEAVRQAPDKSWVKHCS
jgi:hypothetical protein